MSDDYPTDEELEKIRTWDAIDLEGIFEYVISLWHWPDCANVMPDINGQKCFKFHTSGWSGNEDLIQALRENWPAWALSFYQETRGGHFEFRFMGIVREDKPE